MSRADLQTLRFIGQLSIHEELLSFLCKKNKKYGVLLFGLFQVPFFLFLNIGGDILNPIADSVPIAAPVYVTSACMQPSRVNRSGKRFFLKTMHVHHVIPCDV